MRVSSASALYCFCSRKLPCHGCYRHRQMFAPPTFTTKLYKASIFAVAIWLRMSLILRDIKTRGLGYAFRWRMSYFRSHVWASFLRDRRQWKTAFIWSTGGVAIVAIAPTIKSVLAPQDSRALFALSWALLIFESLAIHFFIFHVFIIVSHHHTFVEDC